MPALTPADKAFVVAEYYAGSSASQIQRKFKRDRNKSVSLPTVSRWLKRVKSDFVTTCSLHWDRNNTVDTCVKRGASGVQNATNACDSHLPLKTAGCHEVGLDAFEPP